MLKVVSICFGLGAILFAVGSFLPESKVDTSSAHYNCTINKDNQAEAVFRANLNGEYSNLAVARELNNICRIFAK